MMTELDLTLLPILLEEDIVSRFAGGVKYNPCCSIYPSSYCDPYSNPFWGENRSNTYFCYFTDGICKTTKLVFTNICCCFHYPIKQRVVGFMTTHTMYYLSSNKAVYEPFFLTWVPIKSLTGYSTTVAMTGAVAYQELGCFCCDHRQLKPYKGPSSYEMNIRTSEGFSIPLAYNIPHHNWLEDEHYIKMSAMMAASDIRHEQVLSSLNLLPNSLPMQDTSYFSPVTINIDGEK